MTEVSVSVRPRLSGTRLHPSPGPSSEHGRRGQAPLSGPPDADTAAAALAQPLPPPRLARRWMTRRPVMLTRQQSAVPPLTTFGGGVTSQQAWGCLLERHVCASGGATVEASGGCGRAGGRAGGPIRRAGWRRGRAGKSGQGWVGQGEAEMETTASRSDACQDLVSAVKFESLESYSRKSAGGLRLVAGTAEARIAVCATISSNPPLGTAAQRGNASSLAVRTARLTGTIPY